MPLVFLFFFTLYFVIMGQSLVLFSLDFGNSLLIPLLPVSFTSDSSLHIAVRELVLNSLQDKIPTLHWVPNLSRMTQPTSHSSCISLPLLMASWSYLQPLTRPKYARLCHTSGSMPTLALWPITKCHSLPSPVGDNHLIFPASPPVRIYY
jgi:hypothetical protein